MKKAFFCATSGGNPLSKFVITQNFFAEKDVTYSHFVATARTAATLLLICEAGSSFFAKRLIILRNYLIQSELFPIREVIIFALMIRLFRYLFGNFWPICAMLSQSSPELFELVFGPLPGG